MVVLMCDMFPQMFTDIPMYSSRSGYQHHRSSIYLICANIHIVMFLKFVVLKCFVHVIVEGI